LNTRPLRPFRDVRHNFARGKHGRGALGIAMVGEWPSSSSVLDVGSDYFAGRRGRCFAGIDLMMSRPLPRGSIGIDARRSDSVISARTAGVDRWRRWRA
jgi:hypothetical protein